MELIKLSNKLIEKGKSINGGYSKHQLELLGIDWPPKKGWKKQIIGKQIQKNILDKFIELKDKHN